VTKLTSFAVTNHDIVWLIWFAIAALVVVAVVRRLRE
jgi:hypothetical protein